MDPTDNQDELMHDLIRDSTTYVAPEFDEDENDGSQFLNLHYHGDEDQDISGEEDLLLSSHLSESCLRELGVEVLRRSTGNSALLQFVPLHES